MPARRIRGSWAVAAVLGVLLVGALYLLLAGRGTGETVNVTVREGAPVLSDDQNALVMVRGDIVKQLLETGIAEADLPFKVADINVEMEPTGIQISGRAATKLFSVPVSAKFSAVVHPQARTDGSIGVQLTNVRAASGRLPAVFEPALESVINDELNRATRIEGFQVSAVEMAHDAMLVYLRFNPAQFQLGRAVRQ